MPARAHPALPTAWLLVAGQMLLLAALVLLPAGEAWPVPGWLRVLGLAAVAGGLVVVLVAATALGRGLTAVPLPNRHAVLRTGGLYRWVRHPVYSGLLLAATGVVAVSGSAVRAGVLVALVALLHVKARFEERHLTDRFEGYAAYAARTPRFVPSLRGPGRRPGRLTGG